MNVCFLAQQSVGMVGGGPLIQLRETARYLPEFGVNVGFFNQWEDFPRDQYDLVHLFGANFMNYDVALRLHQFGIPFVVSSIFYTMHSPAFIRLTSATANFAARFFRGIRTDYGFTGEVCRLSKMVLPNTSAEAEIIEKGFGVPHAQVQVIPNGVHERFAQADPKLFVEKYGVQDFVLNVGHIGSQRKNVLNLIRAMQDIDCPLVLIGKVQEGAYAQQCLKEAAKNPRVKIIEGLPNDSPLLASAYAASSVFALPSIFETPGIAALEAGLAGADVVITPYGGTRDYFGDDAIYVEPKSPSSIAEGIQKALSRSHPLLRGVSRVAGRGVSNTSGTVSGRTPDDGRGVSNTSGTVSGPTLQDRIMREFTWQHVAQKTASAYRDAMGSEL